MQGPARVGLAQTAVSTPSTGAPALVARALATAQGGLAETAASVATPPATASSTPQTGAGPQHVEAVPASAAGEAPRLYARARFVWIRPEPNAGKEWIGYLWTGGSVALKSA